MEFKERLDKWKFKFKKYFFYYRDGYFELPYLSNSPDVMINSLMNMPFTKHNSDEKAIYSQNIFTDGVLYYRELADGLWIIITEIKFLKNVCTNALYDEEPNEYYFLSHLSFRFQSDDNNINTVKVPKVGWTLYKPGHEAKAYYNKGTNGIFTNIIFTKSWAEKNIAFKHFKTPNSLSTYLDSNKTLMIWSNLVPEGLVIVDNMLNILKSKVPESINHMQLTTQCLVLITKFIEATTELELQNYYEDVLMASDIDYLVKTEKILMDSLSISFPSIQLISKMVHVSPTKLKQNFKIFYGKPIFQYYQEKQMILALNLLKTEGATVKEVAFSLGYEYADNFSAAFKKYHNFTPSDFLKKRQ